MTPSRNDADLVVTDRFGVPGSPRDLPIVLLSLSNAGLASDWRLGFLHFLRSSIITTVYVVVLCGSTWIHNKSWEAFPMRCNPPASLSLGLLLRTAGDYSGPPVSCMVIEMAIYQG